MGKQIPPDGGIDCSGYVLQCYKAAGLLTGLNPLLTSVATLWDDDYRIPLKAEQTLPGDTIYFKDTYQPGLSHIGIVSEPGGLRFLNAREAVASEDYLSTYWRSKLAGYGRPKGL
jgi:cell wall-associated NlpC family hydrolase